MPDSHFQTLVTRLRAGDDDAAAELVRLYEPDLRRFLRVRLAKSGSVKRAVESADICQLVFADFLPRVRKGEYDLDNAEQLRKLLFTMSRNKYLKTVKRYRAARRDAGRVSNQDVGDLQVAGLESTPSAKVSRAEQIELVLTRLTEQERFIADQRRARRSWSQIAQALGESADAVRVRFSRRIDGLIAELHR